MILFAWHPRLAWRETRRLATEDYCLSIFELELKGTLNSITECKWEVSSLIYHLPHILWVLFSDRELCAKQFGDQYYYSAFFSFRGLELDRISSPIRQLKNNIELVIGDKASGSSTAVHLGL